jgi:hypothetical protein
MSPEGAGADFLASNMTSCPGAREHERHNPVHADGGTRPDSGSLSAAQQAHAAMPPGATDGMPTRFEAFPYLLSLSKSDVNFRHKQAQNQAEKAC